MIKTIVNMRRVSLLAACGILVMTISASVLPAFAGDASAPAVSTPAAATPAAAAPQAMNQFKPLKALPSSFALPLYTKNVKKTSFAQKTAPPYTGLCALVMTTDDFQTVCDFYKGYLAKNGWKTTTQKKEKSSPAGPFEDQTFSVRKGQVAGTVHVSAPKDGKSSIIDIFQYGGKT